VVPSVSAMPDTGWIPGAGIRSKLMGVAKGVASAVGAEVERQLEDRVRSFVDGALGRALDLIVERASDPRYAADMGTEFLMRIGEIASASLSRLIRPE